MNKPLIIGKRCDAEMWRMLNARTGATMIQYEQAFERRALTKDIIALLKELRDTGRTVLLLGDHTFNIPPILVHPQWIAGCIWRQIPNPAVDVAWYNEPHNRVIVELLLEELYLKGLCDADYQST